MNNLSQAERNAVQKMDDNEYGREAESHFENEEEENDGRRDYSE